MELYKKLVELARLKGSSVEEVEKEVETLVDRFLGVKVLRDRLRELTEAGRGFARNISEEELEVIRQRYRWGKRE